MASLSVYNLHLGDFRFFSKHRFFEVFAGSWGLGVVLNRLWILKDPGGLNFSSGAWSWSSFISIDQVGQNSAPPNMCFFQEIIQFYKTRFRSILWGVNRYSERIREKSLSKIVFLYF